MLEAGGFIGAVSAALVDQVAAGVLSVRRCAHHGPDFGKCKSVVVRGLSHIL
jgi:hypothetical protein